MSGNFADEDTAECPLCMEPFGLDDLNFYPCVCRYQICRFCWHRIRTDENGLCPHCREPYSENPAEYTPLTQEQIVKLKSEKRQKSHEKKQKVVENKKSLGAVRVVQKNLVFVIGLSPRLADPEVLKKHEYFGRFGKIFKVVINNSTVYSGSQGPSVSAYVTYCRNEDASKAIQALNNACWDGRSLRVSFGTTKYCTFFLRGIQCSKPDCMYLHELGEEQASFTKEDMQLGKHQQYENVTLAASNVSQPSSSPSSSSSSSSNSNNSNRPAQQRPPATAARSREPSISDLNDLDPITVDDSLVIDSAPSADSCGVKESSKSRHHHLHHSKEGQHSHTNSGNSASSARQRERGGGGKDRGSLSHKSSTGGHGKGGSVAPRHRLGGTGGGGGGGSEQHHQHLHQRTGGGSKNATPSPHMSPRSDSQQSSLSNSSSSGSLNKGGEEEGEGEVEEGEGEGEGEGGREREEAEEEEALMEGCEDDSCSQQHKTLQQSQVITSICSAGSGQLGSLGVSWSGPGPTSSATGASIQQQHQQHSCHDDDLGFDPWDVSKKGLADLLQQQQQQPHPLAQPGGGGGGGEREGEKGGEGRAEDQSPISEQQRLASASYVAYGPTANGSGPDELRPLTCSNEKLIEQQKLAAAAMSGVLGGGGGGGGEGGMRSLSPSSWQEEFKALFPSVNISFADNWGRKTSSLRAAMMKSSGASTYPHPHPNPPPLHLLHRPSSLYHTGGGGGGGGFIHGHALQSHAHTQLPPLAPGSSGSGSLFASDVARMNMAHQSPLTLSHTQHQKQQQQSSSSDWPDLSSPTCDDQDNKVLSSPGAATTEWPSIEPTNDADTCSSKPTGSSGSGHPAPPPGFSAHDKRPAFPSSSPATAGHAYSLWPTSTHTLDGSMDQSNRGKPLSSSSSLLHVGGGAGAASTGGVGMGIGNSVGVGWDRQNPFALYQQQQQHQQLQLARLQQLHTQQQLFLQQQYRGANQQQHHPGLFGAATLTGLPSTAATQQQHKQLLQQQQLNNQQQQQQAATGVHVSASASVGNGGIGSACMSSGPAGSGTGGVSVSVSSTSPGTGVITGVSSMAPLTGLPLAQQQYLRASPAGGPGPMALPVVVNQAQQGLQNLSIK